MKSSFSRSFIRRCCSRNINILVLTASILTLVLCIAFYFFEDASHHLWPLFIVVTFGFSLIIGGIVLFFKHYIFNMIRNKSTIERQQTAMREYQERKKLYGSIQSFCAQYPDI